MARELMSTKPRKELAEMKSELERLMDAFLYGKPRITATEEPPHFPLDIRETEDNIVITAEIPGLDAEDFDISLGGSVLTIRGEKKEEREGKKENFHLQERIYGPFIRWVDLPKQVQGNRIKALYRDGILTVTLPKWKETRKKEVKIKIK